MDFQDEYPPELQIFDTERGVTLNPAETSFSFSSDHLEAQDPCLLIEPWGYIPSPDELMTAPFFPDRSQRILAIHFGQCDTCYAINTELLLKLAREREGQGIEWDEWGAHTIEAHGGGLDALSQIRISGCLLFCTGPNSVDNDSCRLWIYDFSHVGRAKYLCTPDGASEGGGTRRISPRLDGYELHWNSTNFRHAISTSGHDNIIFGIVSILTFLSAAK